VGLRRQTYSEAALDILEELLHVDTAKLPHSKSGIAYQDRHQQPEAIVDREPHQRVSHLDAVQPAFTGWLTCSP
jgi:hypothetical protein